MEKYRKDLIPGGNKLFTNTLRSNFHVYEEIQNTIGPIMGCGSYLHGGFSKDYNLEYYEKQQSLFDIVSQNKFKNILEIGVFDGSSGLIMLSASKDITIYGIDICENDYPEKSVNILNKHYNNRYNLIRGSSSNEINKFKLKTLFDMIHIDADHSFEAVVQDILNCIRFCHNNTLWIFDDIDNIGVSNALKYYGGKFEIQRISGTHCICKLKSIPEDRRLPTIVTSLYDIRSIENNNGDVKKMDHYIQMGKQLLELEIPIIVYTEEKLISKILELRPKELCGILKIVSVPLEESPFYKDYQRIKDNFNKFEIMNRYKDKDTPLYYIVNNNKFNCIKSAIELNPFKSTHFLWMDFGICNNVKNIQNIRRWIYAVPDKIKQMEINPFIENVNYKEYFKLIRHNIAGSLFSGSKDFLLKYCNLFSVKLNLILNEGWHQLDEAVMTIIAKENPDMFDHYYGDYQNLVSGYDNFFKLDNDVSTNLIFSCIEKCLNAMSHKKAYQILQYLKSYYLYNQKAMEKYIGLYIVCNYYINKILDDDIIEAMLTPPVNLKFLNSIDKNLKFYSNYNKIIK